MYFDGWSECSGRVDDLETDWYVSYEKQYRRCWRPDKESLSLQQSNGFTEEPEGHKENSRSLIQCVHLHNCLLHDRIKKEVW